METPGPEELTHSSLLAGVHPKWRLTARYNPTKTGFLMLRSHLLKVAAQIALTAGGALIDPQPNSSNTRPARTCELWLNSYAVASRAKLATILFERARLAMS